MNVSNSIFFFLVMLLDVHVQYSNIFHSVKCVYL